MNTDENNREIAGQDRHLLICGLLEQLAHHDLYFVRIMNRIIHAVNRGDSGDGSRRVAEELQEYRQLLLEIHVRIFSVTDAVSRRVPQAQIPDSAWHGEWVERSLERLEQLENYRRELIHILKATQGR